MLNLTLFFAVCKHVNIFTNYILSIISNLQPTTMSVTNHYKLYSFF
nr:MAG TPA: hypothetical protein [Caudoviricetes sp.]